MPDVATPEIPTVDHRHAVDFLLDVFSRPSSWSSHREVVLRHQRDIVQMDFASVRALRERLVPWLDTPGKVLALERSLRALRLRVEVRLGGHLLAALGPGGAERVLPPLLSTVVSTLPVV